eukprot:scaffold73321_cov36-Tisochrysis_lutea.AAC.4
MGKEKDSRAKEPASRPSRRLVCGGNLNRTIRTMLANDKISQPAGELTSRSQLSVGASHRQTGRESPRVRAGKRLANLQGPLYSALYRHSIALVA